MQQSKVKTFLLQRCALRKFHVIDGQNMRFTIRLRVIESPNASDQIAFCAFHSFHSFLVEVQMNAGYIHVTHA